MSFSVSSYVRARAIVQDDDDRCSYVIDVPKDYDAKTHNIVKIGNRYVVIRKCALPDELFEVK